MKKKFFILAATLLLLNFVSCKTASNKTELSNKTEDSSNSSDWTGIYTGIIPSAGGEGINVKITLSADEIYIVEYQYIGKSDSVFADTGKFSRNPDKEDLITFEKERDGDFPSYYKLGENTLTQLDLEGNIIIGEFAENYILKRQ